MCGLSTSFNSPIILPCITSYSGADFSAPAVSSYVVLLLGSTSNESMCVISSSFTLIYTCGEIQAKIMVFFQCFGCTEGWTV